MQSHLSRSLGNSQANGHCGLGQVFDVTEPEQFAITPAQTGYRRSEIQPLRQANLVVEVGALPLHTFVQFDLHDLRPALSPRLTPGDGEHPRQRVALVAARAAKTPRLQHRFLYDVLRVGLAE